MKTVKLESIIADTILWFCENAAELGCPQDQEVDLWYRYLSPKEQLKVAEKLEEIMERKYCDVCGRPFPPQTDDVLADIKKMLDEVKTCPSCLNKSLAKKEKKPKKSKRVNPLYFTKEEKAKVDDCEVKEYCSYYTLKGGNYYRCRGCPYIRRNEK